MKGCIINWASLMGNPVYIGIYVRWFIERILSLQKLQAPTLDASRLKLIQHLVCEGICFLFLFYSLWLFNFNYLKV